MIDLRIILALKVIIELFSIVNAFILCSSKLSAANQSFSVSNKLCYAFHKTKATNLWKLHSGAIHLSKRERRSPGQIF